MNKKALVIILCMFSVFLCGLVIGYSLGIEERYILLNFIEQHIIPNPKIPNIPHLFSPRIYQNL